MAALTRHCISCSSTTCESDYYWQCHPQITFGQCEPGPGKEIPGILFRSGYQGLPSDVNELFVLPVVPGDSIPKEKRWWWSL